MKPLQVFSLALIALLPVNVPAETVKDREGAVRNDRATWGNDNRWIYDDYKKGFAEARRTGKPLLVVLRCIPCLACSGIDAQVLLENSELSLLLDQFVCVRVINANALDLSLFQVDYDLSFSTVFFNGDGTIYGRYGSWTHQKNPQDKTTAGYRRALEGALAIHRNYPENKDALRGKQGVESPFKTPVNIPKLSGKYSLELNWDGKVVPSCVHCHQIGDAMRQNYRDQSKIIPDEWIFFWPAPETIGLTLSGDEAARVEVVAPASIAGRAGFRVGDDIISLAGQPLISIADVSWVLHRAPEQGILDAIVRRKNSEEQIKIELPKNWRRKSDFSKRVSAWHMRGMATGGMMLEDLPDAIRAERRLGTDSLALVVRMLGQFGKHAAGRNAGFQKDDVIVEMAGISTRMTESELIAHLLQREKVGQKVKATVLRGEQRLELFLPMQ